MREVLDGLRSWRAAGRRFALVTVVSTWGSAPRPAGTAMAVAEDGEVLGNITGGCVEAVVHDVALRVIASGRAERCRFGVETGEIAVGLMCGGEVDVYVEPVEPTAGRELDQVLAGLAEGRPVSLTTSLNEDGPAVHRLETDVTTIGSDEVELRAEDDGSSTLVRSFAAPARMIIFGAVDLADSLAQVAGVLGYRVTVCDARPVFATEARFPHADEVVVAWPHRYLASQYVDAATVLCVLTHDPKVDQPLLEAALGTGAGYIGVMGSRRTQDERLLRLRERGFGDAALERLRGPIGLDLGARTPAETAVSIAAEILAWRHQRSGQPLRDLTVPIHDVPRSALVCGP